MPEGQEGHSAVPQVTQRCQSLINVLLLSVDWGFRVPGCFLWKGGRTHSSLGGCGAITHKVGKSRQRQSEGGGRGRAGSQRQREKATARLLRAQPSHLPKGQELIIESSVPRSSGKR